MTAHASACVLLVAFGAAGAQSTRELRFEGGAAEIRQSGHATRDALLLGALWRGSEDRLATLLLGAATFARDSVAAAQAVAAFAVRPTSASRIQTEGGVSGAAFGISEPGHGGNLGAFARQRFGTTALGVWMGGAIGYTERTQVSAQSTTLDAGTWGRAGDVAATLAYARRRSTDWALLEASGIFLTRDAQASDLADVTAAVRYASGPLEVDVSQVWRTGLRATAASQTALFWSAAYAFSPRVSVAIAGGRQLADPVRGVPDVEITSAALRMTFPRSRAAVNGAAVYASLVPQPEGAVLLVRITASDSSRVEVAGTFSGWEPVPLRRTSDGWEAQIALRPGRHRVAVRVDGGPWRAPAGLAKIRDEFEGESGLIVIP